MSNSNGKITGILSGVAGEYYVAAELSRRGYVASLTQRNTKQVDILATNEDATKTVTIQVKARQGDGNHWLLNEKSEHVSSTRHFFAFVSLRGATERPNFHIVPHNVVAAYIRRSHKKWLATPGRKGRAHRDNPMRGFSDRRNKFRDRWDLLGL